MTIVTVQSSICGRHVNVQFASQDNLALARQIAGAISAEVASGAAITVFSRNGWPRHLPSRQEGVFFQTTDGPTVLRRGYDAVVNTAKQATIVGSSDRNEMVLSGNGDLTFIALGGSGTVVAGGGRDDIRIARDDRGAWLIATGDGNDTIDAAGDGNDTIQPGAGHNQLLLGNGNDLLRLTGNDTVMASRGSATVNAAGAKSTVIDDRAARLTFVGGAGSATVVGGCGSDTVYGGSGRLIVSAGSAGNNLVFAGTGAATVLGGGWGDRVYAQGDQRQALFAGVGNETLSAAQSSGNDSIGAGSGQDMLIGGSGADTSIGGSGAATMQGGSGADMFAFIEGCAGSHDVILNFDAADKIDLIGYGPHADARALASQAVCGMAVTVTLSDSTTITFDNVTRLKSSNFIS
jgi:Ca2+-binding RTX toxin-like protein